MKNIFSFKYYKNFL